MAPYLQDTAPPGGYSAIEWTKFAGKKPSGWKWFGAFIGVKCLGIYWYSFVHKKQKLELYEDADWRVSLLPFLAAESDRSKMKQYHRMIDWETKLMKDYPDWEVGTFKGEELYHNPERKFSEDLHGETGVYLWSKRSRLSTLLLPKTT